MRCFYMAYVRLRCSEAESHRLCFGGYAGSGELWCCLLSYGGETVGVVRGMSPYVNSCHSQPRDERSGYGTGMRSANLFMLRYNPCWYSLLIFVGVVKRLLVRKMGRCFQFLAASCNSVKHDYLLHSRKEPAAQCFCLVPYTRDGFREIGASFTHCIPIHHEGQVKARRTR